MPETNQSDIDALLAARETSRATYNAVVGPAIARKLAALEAYNAACKRADADPANDASWQQAALAHLALNAAVSGANTTRVAAAAVRDAAIANATALFSKSTK